MGFDPQPFGLKLSVQCRHRASVRVRGSGVPASSPDMAGIPEDAQHFGQETFLRDVQLTESTLVLREASNATGVAQALHSFIAVELQQNASQRAAAARALESMHRSVAREVQPRGGFMQSPDLQHQCAERLFEEDGTKIRVAQPWVSLAPEPTLHWDEPILPLLSSLPDVVLPALASLPSATIDLTFDDLDADDLSAGWLRRETTAAEAPASSSSGAPDALLGVRSSGHAVRHHRSRSPQMQTFFTGQIFFPGQMGNVGEFMRDLLVGSARRHGLALWTLPGEMTYAAVELACRRRILSEISGGMTFYFGISENPQRRWVEHTESCCNWQEMIILVQADSSYWTAGLERIFISEFGARFTCLNIGQGGERASAASPHFFYMLVGINGLLRRRGRV